MKNSHASFGSRSPRRLYPAVHGKRGHACNLLRPSRVARLVCGSAIAVILSCLPRQADAGSLSIGFEPAEAIPGTLYGLAAVDVSGGVSDSGVLKMNTV